MVATVNYRTRPKRWSHNTGVCFVRTASVGLSRDFHSILTQVAIHLSAVNNLGMVLLSLILCESWWKGWIKMVCLNTTTYHGDNWWFHLQNHIKKICHGTITSGGCVYPTKN